MNSGIEAGYERVYKNGNAQVKYLSTQLSVARLKEIFYNDKRKQMDGYRFSLEQKGFYKEYKREKEYLSVELVYSSGNYRDYLWRADTVNSAILVDSFFVRKETAAVNFKYGVQFIFKPLIIDFSVGIGFKYRLIRFHDVLYPTLPVTEPGRAHYSFNGNNPREGTTYTMNLPISIKMGVTF